MDSKNSLSERLRDRTTLRFMGDCKCGNCQLVNRPLLDEAIAFIAEVERRPPQPTGEGWRPISEAPKDGTAIQARIPGSGDDNIIAWHEGLIDSNNRSCGGWSFVSDQEPPESWTDGVCWEVNEDGERSTQPTHWKFPPKPAE